MKAADVLAVILIVVAALVLGFAIDVIFANLLHAFYFVPTELPTL